MRVHCLRNFIKEVFSEEMKNKISSKQYESKIVLTEEVIELSNLGYECQPLVKGVADEAKGKYNVKR
ncbi:MAG: hypothetical protein H5T44_00215 [Thermoplasmatales archaeon]|nr:hypothetical protein [Thermoplasmatales archaeon]